MHAVVISVSLDDFDEATRHLKEDIVPQVSQAPGFVSGVWVTIDGNRGRGTIVFESEDQARGVGQQIQEAPNPGVTIDSIDVGEVAATA